MRVAKTLMYLALFAATQAFAGPAIDRSFSAKGDVIGNGSTETLTVHVTGKSIDAPFKWTLTIADAGGATIYRLARNDAWMDANFKRNDFQTGCDGYAACKQMYYFEALPRRIFANTKLSPTAMNKEGILPALPATATKFLKQHRISDAGIAAAIAEMRASLDKPGFHALEIPVSPVDNDTPLVWVASVHMFVPYYEQ